MIAPAATPADFDAARALCWNYRDFLVELGPPTSEMVEVFYAPDAYAVTLDRLEEICAPPRGALLMARLEGRIVGCGMLHEIEPGIAEVKRVYLRPEARGTGLGRALMEALVAQARAQGFARIHMDTGRTQLAAHALYLAMGFVERDAYYEVPEIARGHMHFYEMVL